jgi:hypothetical protein
MILVKFTVKRNFSGSALNEGAKREINSGAKMIIPRVIVPVIKKRSQNKAHMSSLDSFCEI